MSVNIIPIGVGAMKVKELIESLHSLPPDAEVVLVDWAESYLEPEMLTSVVFDEETQRVVLDT